MGCKCDGCRAAQRAYQRRYRARKVAGLTRPPVSVVVAPIREEPAGPGAVETAVAAELADLSAAGTRPGLVAVALALGRVLDGRVPTPKPGAAKVLVMVLDTLRKGSELRKPRLASVRAMSEQGGGQFPRRD